MSDMSVSFDANLCAASLAAYSSPATFVAGGDVHAVVTQRLDATVIAFRGTVPTSWEDWFRDFAVWPARIADHPTLGRCHEGFISGAEAILDQLRGTPMPAQAEGEAETEPGLEAELPSPATCR